MKKFIFLLPIVLYAQVIDTIIPLTDRPENILFIPASNELYINCYRENCFVVLDCSTYQVKKIIPLPTSSHPLAFGTWNWRRDKIYFSFELHPDSIAVIDNQTDSIIKWIPITDAPGPPCYNSIEDKIYIAASSLIVIDCEADSIIKIIPPQPYYMRYFTIWDSIGNKVYCGSGGSDKVIVIDCLTDSITKAISTGLGSPYGAVYNSDGRKLYAGGFWGMGCVVIDAIRDTMIKYHNVWYYDEVIPVWNRFEDKVYWPGDSLHIINCQTDSIINSYDYIVGNMGFASWSNHLYLTCDTWAGHPQGILRILDCHNDSLIAHLWIGPGVTGILGYPEDKRIYIATSYDSSIYVIKDEIPGIEEHQKLDAISLTPKIYPNPAKSFLAIHLLYSADRQTIKIFDVSGKMAKEEEVTSAQEHNQEIRISLKGISPGIYFLRINNETKKFLVVE